MFHVKHLNASGRFAAPVRVAKPGWAIAPTLEAKMLEQDKSSRNASRG